MQASLVARLPLVGRSHWRPTHGNQPILLKKGTLGSGPNTHIMSVGLDPEFILELLGLHHFKKV